MLHWLKSRIHIGNKGSILKQYILKLYKRTIIRFTIKHSRCHLFHLYLYLKIKLVRVIRNRCSRCTEPLTCIVCKDLDSYGVGSSVECKLTIVYPPVAHRMLSSEQKCTIVNVTVVAAMVKLGVISSNSVLQGVSFNMFPLYVRWYGEEFIVTKKDVPIKNDIITVKILS